MHTHTYPDAAILPLPDSSFTRGMGSVPRKARAPGDGGEGGTLLDHPEPGLFQRKALCSWLFFFFPFFFPCASPAPPPGPRSLHQSCCRQCWKRTAFERKKMALVVLLWASLRGLMSVNVTAWVSAHAAVRQGQSQSLSELESSFSSGGSGGGGAEEDPA